MNDESRSSVRMRAALDPAETAREIIDLREENARLRDELQDSRAMLGVYLVEADAAISERVRRIYLEHKAEAEALGFSSSRPKGDGRQREVRTRAERERDIAREDRAFKHRQAETQAARAERAEDRANRAEAERDQAREVLRKIADYSPDGVPTQDVRAMARLARAALSGDKENPR